MKRITYSGTGSTYIEGFGTVDSGGSIEVSDEIAAALCKQNPADWQLAGEKKKPDKGGGE